MHKHSTGSGVGQLADATEKQTWRVSSRASVSSAAAAIGENVLAEGSKPYNE